MKGSSFRRRARTQSEHATYNKYFDLGVQAYNNEIPLNSDQLLVFMEELRIKSTESYFDARNGFRQGYTKEALHHGYSVEQGKRLVTRDHSAPTIHGSQMQLL